MISRLPPAPALAALAALAAYVATLAPGVTFEDSGELIAAAYVAGIPHEPGYPLYTMLGHVLAQLPLGSVAWRLNLFSALASAVGVFFFTRALQRCMPAGAALAGGLLLAFSREAWSQSLIAEVYGLNLALFGLMLDLLLRWQFEDDADRRRRQLVALALVLGLASSNHSAAALWAPAALLAVLLHRPREALDPGLVARAVGAFVLGLAPLLYLPLASLRDPAMDWGDPETLRNFARVVTRHQYGVDPVQGIGDVGAQLGLLARLTAAQWPVVVLLLVPPGLWLAARQWRQVAAPVVLLWLVCGPLVAVLTNFPIATPNAIVNAENTALASVFFIPAHALCALAAALGLALLTQRLPARAAALLALSLPVAVAAWQLPRVDMSGQRFSQHYLDGLLALAGPNALVLTAWDPHHFPTLYAQLVERRRPDVTVIDQSMLSTSWYLLQAQRRAPALLEPVRPQADSFLTAVAAFESGDDGARDAAYAQYRSLVDALALSAARSGRDVLLTSEPTATLRQQLAVEPAYWGWRLRAAPAVSTLDPAALHVAEWLSPDVANDRMATHVRNQLEQVMAERLRWCDANGPCADRAALADLVPRFAAARVLLSARAR